MEDKYRSILESIDNIANSLQTDVGQPESHHMENVWETLLLFPANDPTDLPSFPLIKTQFAKVYESRLQTARNHQQTELIALAKVSLVLYSTTLNYLLDSSFEYPQSLEYLYKSQSSPIRLYLSFLQRLPSLLYPTKSISQFHKNFLSPFHTTTYTTNTVRTFKNIYTTLKSKNINTFKILTEKIKSQIKFQTHLLQSIRIFEAASVGLLYSRGFGIEQQGLTNGVFETLELMNFIIDKRTDVNDGDLDRLETFRKSRPGDVEGIYELISMTIQKLQGFQKDTRVIHQVYGKPSFLSRYWPHITISSITLLIAFRNLTISGIQNIFTSIGDTIKSFTVNWVVDPIKRVYETVRHKDGGNLAIMGKDSLNSDIESLERMVVDLARDNGVSDVDELQGILSNLRNGDMTMVMESYEKQIKHPVLNAIGGDLLRTLLIQVHKAKVDGELAMSALDQLLKSNELNFAFLAAIPSTALLFFLCKKTWSVLFQGEPQWKLEGKAYIRKSLWEVERILNSKSDETFSIQDEGLLLCQIHLLRKTSSMLRGEERERFRGDLADLEKKEFTTEQKMKSIERMYRNYKFLC